MEQSRHLTAKKAARALDISLSTLYAYVSRGLIRSEAAGVDKKTRLYHAEDVHHLKERKEARRNSDRVAQKALHTGAPVLESAITLITHECVYYRGHSALSLAVNHSIEQVAALIWTGDLNTRLPNLDRPVALSPDCRAVLNRIAHLKPTEVFQVLLPLAAEEDPVAYDLHPATVVQTGARILRFLTTLAAESESPGTLAETLQQSWAPDHPRAAALLNTALVLYADHELNASAFTARCAASTGATPYAAVNAALSALSGPKHGTASERIEALLREIEAGGDVKSALIDRLKRGEPIHGFGHAVYKDIDPRARLLLEQIQTAYPDSPHVALTRSVIDETHHLQSARYNIDLPLVTLSRILDFPDGRAAALFALGRTIGWIGHILEQYGENRLIRPRARYVGPQPVA